MSRITLSGNASGTGNFTIASPGTNTDRTLTLPDATGTVATSDSTLAQFNASGSAPVYACRAWVNFNGTGTVAIRASGNVSSITDNGVGDYTVNLTTAMQDNNFAALMASNQAQALGAPLSTSTINVLTTNSAGSSVDASVVSVAVFR